MEEADSYHHPQHIHFKKTSSYQYATSLLISFVVASLLTYIIPQVDGTDLIAIIFTMILFYWIVFKDLLYFFLVSKDDQNKEWGEYVDQALNIGLFTLILLEGIYVTGYLTNVFNAQTRPLMDIITLFVDISLFISIVLVLSNPVPKDVDEPSKPVHGGTDSGDESNE